MRVEGAKELKGLRLCSCVVLRMSVEHTRVLLTVDRPSH
jgi:hypothetical protein